MIITDILTKKKLGYEYDQSNQMSQKINHRSETSGLQSAYIPTDHPRNQKSVISVARCPAHIQIYIYCLMQCVARQHKAKASFG